MNKLHLKYFLLAAEQNNFSRAAQLLHVTQASLSTIISKLEKEVGYPLFERQGRNMQLTPYGKILRQYAAKIITVFSDLKLELAESKGDAISCTIILGVSYTLVPEQWLLQIMQQNPQLLLKKQLLSPSILQEKLLRRELDFGLSSTLPLHPQLESRLLVEDNFLILFPPGEPLPAKKQLSLQDLTQLPFLCRFPSAQERAIDLLARQIAIPLNIVYEGPEENILDLFCHSYGVILTSTSQKNIVMRLPCICSFLPLAETQIRNRIYLTWHKDRYFPPDIRLFHQALLQYTCVP